MGLGIIFGLVVVANVFWCLGQGLDSRVCLEILLCSTQFLGIEDVWK